MTVLPNTSLEPTGVGAFSSAARFTSQFAGGSLYTLGGGIVTKISKSLWFCCILLLVGCGSTPPSPNSTSDIRRLPSSTRALGPRGLSDDDIPALDRLPQLRKLFFSQGMGVEPARLTDQGLARLAALQGLTIEILDLGYCDNITDMGLVHVAKMNSVTWLSLRVCPRITDAGFPALMAMTNLTGLDLRGCPSITDRALENLAGKTNWQTIWFGGCPNVTEAAVEKLQRALPNAQVTKDEKEWSYHKSR